MKRIIDDETLLGLANALRKVTGKNRTYTPEEMIEEVTTIMEAATYILVDEDGNEVPAVFVANEPILTATPNDIRIGTTAVTSDGIVEGEKEIPSYFVNEGYRLITNGSKYTIPIADYDFKKLQVLICKFNTSLTNSVSTEKVAIDGAVYNVSSTVKVAGVSKDVVGPKIDLGITNDSGSTYVIRYFMYREVH